MLTINIQRLLCTVIKLHVVKEAKEAVLYFLQDLNVNFYRGMTIIRPDIGLIYSFLTAECIDLSLIIDYSMYFKDIIQYYYCQFSPVSA